MNKFVPMDTGDLRNIVDKGVDYITYEVPYAHYQFVNQFPEENYTTPGTGPYWDKRMWSVKKDEILKEVQDEVRKHGNK